MVCAIDEDNDYTIAKGLVVQALRCFSILSQDDPDVLMKWFLSLEDMPYI